jgi:adiponectin receptor
MSFIPTPITVWLFVSSCVVAWDVGFILMRPRSMLGGDLHWFWKPYGLYSTIDLVYSHEAFLNKDPFPTAQAILNIFECLLNFYSLSISNQSLAIPMTMIALTMTFWKTFLYFTMDIVTGFSASGHNDVTTWITLYLLPNSFWIIIPFLSLISLTKKVTKACNVSPKKFQ